MPEKSPNGPEIKTTTPEKKKKVPKSRLNENETPKEAWEEELGAMKKAQMMETPPEAWEKFGKDVLKTKKKAESLGLKTEINPDNKPSQPNAPEKAVDAVVPKEQGPTLENRDIEDLTTRVKGMREGLELRREALATEKAPAQKPTAEELALQKESIKAANTAADEALVKIRESGKPMSATREHIEILRRGIVEAIKEGNAELAQGFTKELENIHVKLENAKAERDASTEEKEKLLAALAAQNKIKPEPAAGAAPGSAPTPPPAPDVPQTPEQLQALLEVARKEFADASKERKATHKAKIGFFSRAKEKVFGTKEGAVEQTDEYKLANEKYQKAKVAIAQSKLKTLEAGGKPIEAMIAFAEGETGEYTKLLSPEKQSLVMRSLQAYARMPKRYRIPLTLAISTIAATGVIAATGGFATVGAAMSYAGYRGARAGAGVLGSTAITELYGNQRNKAIKNVQEARKEEIGKLIAPGNLNDILSRVEALTAERRKFDTQTGLRKAIMAVALGGGVGLASALDSHLHIISSAAEGTLPAGAPDAPDVFKTGTTPWNAQGSTYVASNLEAAPVGKIVAGPNLDPPVRGDGDNAPNLNKYSTLTPESPDNYADNPPVQEGQEVPTAADPSATVTKAPIVGTDTSVTVKPGDNLWKLNERMLMQNKEFAGLSSAKKQWVLSTIEKSGYEHLSKEELVSRGFGLDATGKINLNTIQAGAQLRLSDLNSPTGLQGVKLLIQEANTLTPGDEQNILSHGSVTHATPAAEPIHTASAVEAAAQPLNPDSVKGAWPLLAKGIMSKPEDVYSNYNGRMNFKGLGLSYDQYKWLNSELIAAQDTYKISFDNNKLIGKVLEELAQKRAASGVKLAA